MNPLKPFFKYVCVAGALACFATTALAQNVVVNGGFESGFAGYTVNDPSFFTNVGADAAFANSGTRYANLGARNVTGSLSQVLNTVAGATYTLSFFLANNSSAPVSTFEALVNGVVAYTTTGLSFGTAGTYQMITISGLVAAGPNTTLQFRYRHDDDFWRLDDIAFTRTTGVGVPEGGATLWLMLPLFAGLCVVHFRLRSRRAIS